MTTRQELLTHWQNQLHTAEEDSVAFSWRARIRRRLYRFLLAMYGGASWSGTPQDADDVMQHPAKLLVSDDVDLPESSDEATLLDYGKAPRTRAEILRGLKNVRGLSEELAPPGPLQKGLPANAPVAVASCKKLSRARRIKAQLISGGFDPTLTRRAELYQVFVVAHDATAAIEMLRRLEREVASPQTGHVRILTTRDEAKSILVVALISGIIGIPLSFYVLTMWQLGQHLSRPPNPEWFSVALIAAAILDFNTVLFIWLAHRSTQQSHKRGASGPR